MVDLSAINITMADIRKAGFCASGARGWFRARGISFNDFLKSGMAADEFIAKGDDLSRAVVERKIEREHLNG